jgi:hypothetical protein
LESDGEPSFVEQVAVSLQRYVLYIFLVLGYGRMDCVGGSCAVRYAG